MIEQHEKIPEKVMREQITKQSFKNEHIFPFELRGSKMREWVLIISENFEDYLEDKEVFVESIDFVFSLTKKN